MSSDQSIALVARANRGTGLSLVSSLLEAGARRVFATERDIEALERAQGIANTDVHSAIQGAIDTDRIRAFPIPKTSPEAAADAIVASIDSGDEDIVYPMAREVFTERQKDSKAFERHFGAP